MGSTAKYPSKYLCPGHEKDRLDEALLPPLETHSTRIILPFIIKAWYLKQSKLFNTYKLESYSQLVP